MNLSLRSLRHSALLLFAVASLVLLFQRSGYAWNCENVSGSPDWAIWYRHCGPGTSEDVCGGLAVQCAQSCWYGVIGYITYCNETTSEYFDAECWCDEW